MAIFKRSSTPNDSPQQHNSKDAHATANHAGTSLPVLPSESSAPGVLGAPRSSGGTGNGDPVTSSSSTAASIRSSPALSNGEGNTEELDGLSGGAALAGRRTESPTNFDRVDEPESDEEQEFKDVEEPVSTAAGEANGVGEGGEVPRSRAAKLAAEGMEALVTLRQKLGKPLAELTLQDVQLTDADIEEDMHAVWKAMHLFMNSRMLEAEEICLAAADHRLYYSVGYSLIQGIKSLMTFEPDDLKAAIQCSTDTIVIAQLLRKKDHSLWDLGTRLAKGSTSVGSIKSMTLVQRHAELVFAESTLLRATLGLIYAGDFLAFIKEALNMRNAYAVCRTLDKFVEARDQEYGGEDPSIDQDFRSGVFLTNGLISLILSLLPSTILKVMTVFGITGDRHYALSTLMKAGRWEVGVKEPGREVEKEGIRRPICDMFLLLHHLVISNYLPVGGVDVLTAANILEYNLDRYPNGVFFLYFAGRLYATQTQLDAAEKAFLRAIDSQKEYKQLAHLCHWDLGLVSLASGKYAEGIECFQLLDKESNWSKAIYAYATATLLYEDGKDLVKAAETMKTVPGLMQRIAGKSIPLEKFVVRRARKFVDQGNRLTLPGIELAYALNCLNLSPRSTLFKVHLVQVSAVLAELDLVKDLKTYGKGGADEYWDDFCLAHLLRAIILRFIAHPEAHTKPDPPTSPIPVEEADAQALISLNNILKHGREIQRDHHLVWFAHYELGRLYDATQRYSQAKEQYELVMSGKNVEISNKKGKGKVSLQNMAVLRSHSALTVMREEGRI